MCTYLKYNLIQFRCRVKIFILLVCCAIVKVNFFQLAYNELLKNNPLFFIDYKVNGRIMKLTLQQLRCHGINMVNKYGI